MLPLVAIATTAPADTVLTPARAAVLGAVQGLTEFLPISSSAHLFVIPELLGWRYGGLAFDVALHGGTLLALLIAFGRDWWTLATDALAAPPDLRAQARRMWLWLIVATVPGALAGKLLEHAAEERLRSLPLQAAMLAVFGFVLWWVDRKAPVRQDDGKPGWGAAAGIGLAQALALVPGVSRSGITITAGRAAGFSRVGAARLSFLLATPITLGAVLLEARHMPLDAHPVALATGVLTSAVVGVLAIRGLLRWLAHAGFGAFFAYRVVLA
ncbi:MAG TPA: undecaprenyl-diphosphate phosphatase, partial [Candidatus Eisenbacteria bacterium]